MNGIIQIFLALEQAGVDYVLCGGMACVMQGCDRTTQDMDIALLMEKSNLEKAIAVFKSLNMIPRIPEPMESLTDTAIRESWINDKGAMVYTLFSSDGLFQVDVFLHYPIRWEDLKMRAQSMMIGKSLVPVSSRADLITAKQAVNPPREKDLWDLRVLLELENGR
jgi:hypothetical protein